MISTSETSFGPQTFVPYPDGAKGAISNLVERINAKIPRVDKESSLLMPLKTEDCLDQSSSPDECILFKPEISSHETAAAHVPQI
jgi:hypothetical protein